ncbi:unnamed protein product [Blepharisma stoltei]|uniref:non-specific serine/threonine protein kinase n=1 Tax=Blepharisma stoltei TaxID=1481888 RepID=A0AAU9JNS0_9CILI|nr:unnamed protein product [Blepharisma stoltei]
MGCSINTRMKRPQITDVPRISQVGEIQIKKDQFVQENQHRFAEVYQIGESLGSGAFGEVKICFQRDTRQKRAVKIMRKDLMKSESKRDDLEKEISILRSMDHPNIVRLYEFFEDQKRIYIVMEHCAGGELFDEIIKRKNFQEVHAAQIMYQLFSAVAYLHSHHVIHRDLKPENILLEESNDTLNIKLIDFGTAVMSNNKIKDAMGTAYYIAPEVLSGQYSEKCDMWSCGVILYILLSGRPPFDGRDDSEIVNKAQIGKFDIIDDPWGRISNEAKNLITGLLCKAESRLSASQCLQHPWITSRAHRPIATEEIIQVVMRNLTTFHNSNKLRDAVNTFIASQCISMQDTRLLREVFRSMDKNGDGKLSREELMEQYVWSLGEADAEIEVNRIMEEVDADHNGYIDYTEFLKATLDMKKLLSSDNLKQAFRMFDRDGSGSISAAELKKILEGGVISDDKVWDDLIVQADQNGDGEIDLQEFQDVILSKV